MFENIAREVKVIKKRKALVVDDSEIAREIVSTALREIGFETVHASDGFEAIEKILSEDISLFVIDINMPKMDGLTLVRKLRKTSKYLNTPIIIFSTEADKKDIEMGLQAGANLYLTKPMGPKALIENFKRFA